MKLEVGMYVRTKWGYICKLININDFREPSMKYGVEANYLRDVMFIGDEDISKASHSLLSDDEEHCLIEVGDYVNGKRVEWIGYDLYRENEDKTLTGIGEKRILFNEFTKDSVKEKGIKSIVTKEQFERMQYRIGE